LYFDFEFLILIILLIVIIKITIKRLRNGVVISSLILTSLSGAQTLQLARTACKNNNLSTTLLD